MQPDSLAARPMVKFRFTGTFFASITAKLATIDPLLAGRTIAIRSSGNSFRKYRLNAAAAPSNFPRLSAYDRGHRSLPSRRVLLQTAHAVFGKMSIQ